jgi:hypothetical protein
MFLALALMTSTKSTHRRRQVGFSPVGNRDSPRIEPYQGIVAVVVFPQLVVEVDVVGRKLSTDWKMYALRPPMQNF